MKRGDQKGGLHFVRHDREQFELEDLLRASAEVLGSGSFGSSYKAVLLNGPAMVVKRFTYMNNVGKEEFQNHMDRLGRLSHPNLLPLVAYYYRKEEKLLISDFVKNGSLASHLHGMSHFIFEFSIYNSKPTSKVSPYKKKKYTFSFVSIKLHKLLFPLTLLSQYNYYLCVHQLQK